MAESKTGKHRRSYECEWFGKPDRDSIVDR